MARQSRQSNPLWVRALSKPTVDVKADHIQCECGGSYREGYFAAHRISATHRQFVCSTAVREDQFEAKVLTAPRQEQVQVALDDLRIVYDISTREPTNLVFDRVTRAPLLLVSTESRQPRRRRVGA